jgi:hypothetical protein
MCCGQRSVPLTPATATEPSTTWVVKDATGSEVAVKASEVAAKLHAARIGGSVEKRVA